MGALVNVPIQEIAQTALANTNSAIDAVNAHAASSAPQPVGGNQPGVGPVLVVLALLAAWFVL